MEKHKMNRRKIISILTIILLLGANVVAQDKTILFVLSAADTLALNDGNKLRQTGVFLNEFYLAYEAVSKAGYAVDFATPNGIVATIDNESVDEKYWKGFLTAKTEAVSFVKTDSAFNNPRTLEQALENKSKYVGMVIPGGQGLMVDLMNDKNIRVLLKYFAEAKKPTGLICHAPSLILTIPKEGNPYIGFKVTSVSPSEEIVIEKFIMKGRPQNRKIARQLRKSGLNYKQGLPKANHAVRDRNLVTSQNPFSSSAFNKLYLKALADYLTH
ncbi:MAG TPA: type 1 glutamine amidotransferase domain-containing protein [Ohtaekwangia sp.]|nr:type 1 glutamine amidotransferase domain-containing protein [Ohtaekwangia sp.]